MPNRILHCSGGRIEITQSGGNSTTGGIILKITRRRERSSSQSTSSLPAGARPEEKSKTSLITAETTTLPRRIRITPNGLKAKTNGWELRLLPAERRARTLFLNARTSAALLTTSSLVIETNMKCLLGKRTINDIRF